jgi:hypothetical protein
MKRRLSLLGAIALGGIAHAQFAGDLTGYGVNLGGNSFLGPVSGSTFADFQPGTGGTGATSTAAGTGFTDGVSWTIWDGYGPHGNSTTGTYHNIKDFGGQQFDAKAMYLSNDAIYLYVSIVTGFNPNSVHDPYGRSRDYRVGDIAINSDWAHKTAAYGLILPTAPDGSSGTGAIKKGGVWYTPDADVGFGPPVYSNYKKNGTNGGSYDYKYSTLLYSGNPVKYKDPVTNSFIDMHLLEARVKLSDIGLGVGDVAHTSWAMSCNNDFIEGNHIIQAVPEPGAYAAIGSGIVTLLGLGRRRK